MLLVDDEAAVLKAVPRVLRTAAPQWRVHVAQTGAAALAILEQNAVDVLVTDLGMPEMDGVELMQIVAARFPDVILVAHSADLAALESEETRSCASFCLAKPVTPERFMEVLTDALARRRLAVGD